MSDWAHRSTFERARQHLASLADAERDFLATTPYRLGHEHDKRAGRYLVRALVASPIPDAIPSLASGVVDSLRDALDALTTTLAGKPTPFPIFESLALFAQRSRKAIASMPDEAQATLEDLQPYHAIGGFRNGALWTLQQLDADEPPRLVPSIVGGTMGVNTRRDVDIEGEPAIVSGPFADGAIVASVAARVVGRDPKLDMFLRPELALAFTSQSAGRGRPVVALLGELCEHVERTVFAALEPALPSPR
ncbi:MAG TPA: hypothetical protein VGP25_02775 [Gemmatimonadaceae bacterium]|nr:hypothetical protein [Gemmatimonadaceae bacterium]